MGAEKTIYTSPIASLFLGWLFSFFRLGDTAGGMHVSEGTAVGTTTRTWPVGPTLLARPPSTEKNTERSTAFPLI
ncbi:hypothetical protein QBC47DRAFT_386825 [Echria macrotheca]|uniref:Uncharacterized protein n=1 Tax=Echria macrotheca TaxID=438768 RepID=A0AAJ0B9C5_9PEZI|nr:hypothetical protein QBC47DRAFT_386825 [Echria macrotheca]